MTQNSIVIKGAREHNLKDVDVTIPRDKLVVITGLSGSGKSSLAFDTIYAEGQRRYVQSLSSYARMFLGKTNKPDVDSIDGLSPAVSIDQKTTSRNPRSTVGTTTEIYDYLRLLYARVGVPHCPECGRVIEKQTTDQVTDKIMKLGDNLRALILAPVVRGRKGEFTKLFEDLRKEGFTRARVDGEVLRLEDEDFKLNKKIKHTIEVVVDRIVIKKSAQNRVAEAVENAVKLTGSSVIVEVLPKGEKAKDYQYSTALACPIHGHSIDELQPRDFSFNAPFGACPDCGGIGSRSEVDPDLVIPDKDLSLAEGAVAPFTTGNYYPQVIRAVIEHLGYDEHTPWNKMSKKAQKALMYGIKGEKIRVNYRTVDGRDTYWFIQWDGIVAAVRDKLSDAKTDHARQKYERYFAVVPCPTCHGKRLRPEYLAVTVNGKSIWDVCEMSSAESLTFFKSLSFTGEKAVIGAPIVKEIRARLQFLVDVGLDYLSLNRATATLSGGEAQRIRLATQIGAGLMGVLYILDEPSIGLHQRDNMRLIHTLEHLRDLGNTVIVVEHDEDTMRHADYLIDMGPGAGELGGHVVAAGTPQDVMACPHSLTGQYLLHKRTIAVPNVRRNPGRGYITISGARENNLKDITVKIPIGTFTLITGVSGSGKSSLVTDSLAPALENKVNHAHHVTGKFDRIYGAQKLDKVVSIDQSPIGRTPRSNPATYVGIWDDIRKLMASTPESKARGYSPGRFSFNVPGGRCEACKGDGQKKIEMNFLPDVYVPCEVCGGKRYNRETLQITYRGKNMYDILQLTVDEALTFFKNIPSLKRKLQTLHDVGLGYIRLGQPATTLSGGEAQRVKLSSELQRRQTGKTFYILDEPTTGLHFEDIRQLLSVLQRLVDAGNTVLVIEHNLDVIKCADYIVDLGPEGGDEGGHIVCCGTPEKVAQCPQSYTGKFLAPMLAQK